MNNPAFGQQNFGNPNMTYMAQPGAGGPMSPRLNMSVGQPQAAPPAMPQMSPGPFPPPGMGPGAPNSPVPGMSVGQPQGVPFMGMPQQAQVGQGQELATPAVPGASGNPNQPKDPITDTSNPFEGLGPDAKQGLFKRLVAESKAAVHPSATTPAPAPQAAQPAQAPGMGGNPFQGMFGNGPQQQGGMFPGAQPRPPQAAGPQGPRPGGMVTGALPIRGLFGG